MNNIALRRFSALVGICLFVAALWVLHRTLAKFNYQDIVTYLRQLSGWRLSLTLVVTALSYAALAGYDLLGLRYLQRALSWWKVGFAAFVSYAFSNTMGLSLLTSGSVRYRLYSSWGLTALDIAAVVMFTTLTFWLGILTVGGLVLTLEPLTLPAIFPFPLPDSRYLGLAMLAAPLAYLGLAVWRRQPFTIRGWRLAMVRPPLAVAQLLVGVLDWTLAGTVLYLLLPASDTLTFLYFLGAFLIAQTAGLISHVPGGLGVFESLILYLLSPSLPAADIFGALLAYRLVYYLLPLTLATVGLGVYEGRHHAQKILWLPRVVGPWIPVVLPQLLALMALVSGAVLLFSSATPAVTSRLAWLEGVIPLPVLEAAHLVASLAGMGLLLLARGLQRRLATAWRSAVVLLMVGIAASLLKGGDYEEAVLLAILLFGLTPSRLVCYRQTALLEEPFTAGWIVTIALILIGALWLGFFSYKDIDYAHELWWRFGFTHEAEAGRLLRAMLGVAILTAGFVGAKLRRPATVTMGAPAAAEFPLIANLVAGSPRTYAYLALLGDKRFLVNRARNAFIMYGVEGRTWAALGDPVSSSDQASRELAWDFRELAERQGGWTVFYQVTPDGLGLYLELGLTLQTIGEEARILLKDFSRAGKSGSLREWVPGMTAAGYGVEVVEPGSVDGLLPQLREVSRAWLSAGNSPNIRFPSAFSYEDYLRFCPLAVVRRGKRIIAFASLLRGGGKEELAVDLLRCLPEAPHSVRDYLLVQLMGWGQERGYRWFNLGIAPPADLENRSLAPLWSCFDAQAFGAGERFRNYGDWRQHLDQFNPQWEPRYLAAPGGIALPHVLRDLTALMAGAAAVSVDKPQEGRGLKGYTGQGYGGDNLS